MDKKILTPAPLDAPAATEKTANTRLHQRFAEETEVAEKIGLRLANIEVQLKTVNAGLESLATSVGGVGTTIAVALETQVGDAIRNHRAAAGKPTLLSEEQKIVLRALNRIEDICNDKTPVFDSNSNELKRIQPDSLSSEAKEILSGLNDPSVNALWKSVSAPFDEALTQEHAGMRSNRVFDCEQLRQVVLNRLPAAMVTAAAQTQATAVPFQDPPPDVFVSPAPPLGPERASPRKTKSP